MFLNRWIVNKRTWMNVKCKDIEALGKLSENKNNKQIFEVKYSVFFITPCYSRSKVNSTVHACNFYSLSV